MMASRAPGMLSAISRVCPSSIMSLLRRIDARLVYHQAQKLDLTLVGGGYGLFPLVAYLAASLCGQALGEQVAAVEHQFLHAFGMLKGEQERHVRAIGKPQDARGANAERL